MMNELLKELPGKEQEKISDVSFPEWMDDNKLRHPLFLGLRSDKEPAAVHKEKN